MARRFKKIPPLNKKWRAWGAKEYSYYGVLGNRKDDRNFRAKALASHARAIKNGETEIEIRYKEDDRDINDIRDLSLNEEGLGEGANYIAGDDSSNTVSGGSTNDYLIGLGGADRLEAGAGNDFLAAQGDGDVLIGGEGEDYFRLSLSLSPQTPDQVLDFDSAEGDKIIFDAPGINTQVVAPLYVISHSEKLLTAFENDALMLYDQKTGKLFFNQNGADSGLGTGGLMAVLVGKPDLSVGDAFII